MIPAFDIEGGLPLALARGVSVAGLAAAFGGVLFARVVAPQGLQPAAAQALRRVAYGGIAAAILGAVIWLVAQTQDMAGSVSPREVWAVLGGTLFGHLLAARLVLLMLAAVAWWQAPVLAVPLAGLALVLQAGHSHAEAMYGPSLLLDCAVLHVLAAGTWLGCLVPLWVLVTREAPEVAWRAARRFSPLGIACVGVLLATASYQGWVLLGGFVGIVGTAYGWMALVKAVLFAVLVGLAVRNRRRCTPGLAGRVDGLAPLTARRLLARNVVSETIVGLLILLAAGVLTELPPGMHTQAVWPFPVRLSFEAVSEDPDFRREAIEGGLAMGAAVVMLLAVAASFWWRRASARGWAVRGGVAVAAACVAVAAAPHLDLLFVPAYPTQYFRSPTGFSADAIVQGAGLFARNCAICHGAAGHGDGPGGKGLSVPPADLTAAHLWMHPDGELFWWLAHGIAAPDGGPAMPGFEGALSDDERWDLIDYIRAHNAGLTVTADGQWGRIVQAPAFGTVCEGGAVKALGDFRGQVVRLVDGPATALPGVVTVTTQAGAQPSAGVCVARDQTVGAAYAVASGLEGDAAGAVFLIDAEGLLRRVWRQAPAGDVVVAAVADVGAHKAVSARAAAAGMKMDGMDMGGMKMDGMKM